MDFALLSLKLLTCSLNHLSILTLVPSGFILLLHALEFRQRPYIRDTMHLSHNIVVVIRVNIFQAETTVEIQLVRSTEVCGKV